MATRPVLKTTPERSRLMSRVRQTGTAPELRVRKLIHALGVRFRTRATDLPGTPDIVNRKHRWVIFVHGCYWHAHAGCRLWKIPTRNRAFWRDKFASNRARDRKKVLALERLGYAVLVIWQCNLDDEQALRGKVLSFLAGRSTVRGPTETSRSTQAVGARRDAAVRRETYAMSPSGCSVLRTVSFSSGNGFGSRQLLCHDLNGQDQQAAFDYAFLRRRAPRRPKR